MLVYATVLLAFAGGLAILGWGIRRRHLDRWLVGYILSPGKRRKPRSGETVHLILCIADHFEPRNGKVTEEVARARVDRWASDYPRLLGHFRDSDGRPPRHTFFYPVEQYHADDLEALAGLCRAGYGEVEIHLHHDGDTDETLRRTLLEAKTLLSERHGLLSRHRDTGELAYGFIHGNWALDNARPDGRWCGVNNELDVLRETGCYADFTMPSAPSDTQTWKINSIYYATDDPHRPKSHNTGIDVGRGKRPDHSLMLVQGPLVLDWRNRKRGIVPRIENGCIQGNQPPSIGRLEAWLRARVQVAGRPDWFFVKLHTHGAPENNQGVLLEQPNVEFHAALEHLAAMDRSFHYHYVTAREMYNLIRAAEAGWKGGISDARDFELIQDTENHTERSERIQPVGVAS
jgi:hypothetical protein